MQAARWPPLESHLVRYSLELADLDRHWIVVECSIDDPAAEQLFRMPSWIPGSYLLREFARHVVAIEAASGGSPVEIEKIDKSGWRVTGAAGSLTVRATIHAHDLSVRGAFVDRRRAFFNGTSVFLLPEGREAEPVQLTVKVPAQEGSAGWRVATAMQAREVDARGFGVYEANDYDELIDHPFEISDHESVSFEAAGIPHELVIAGRFDTDLERVAADLRQVCEAQIDFFGRPPPFEKYKFLGLAVGDGYGGLEHRESSSLIFNRNDLPPVGDPGLPRSYQRFLGLCSHEYFHTWHIKRSKPEAFVPYRLDRRNHTRLLWVFEGITSYYQERFLLASGLLGAQAYLRRLGEALTRVYRVPGRFRQSLAESSFDAWDSLYKPGPDSANTGVSYYSKGSLVALALDLTLRQSSEGRLSLDDVVVELWRRYGARGQGLPEDGFERLAYELAGDLLGDFFDRNVRGTADPDLEALCAAMGLKFELRPATGPADKGGTADGNETPTRESSQAGADAKMPPTLGAIVSPAGVGIRLDTVFDGGPAARAGLAHGDVVIAIERYVLSSQSLDAQLGRHSPGDRVRADYVRDGVLAATEIELAEAPADTCSISLDTGATEQALALRKAWLGE